MSRVALAGSGADGSIAVLAGLPPFQQSPQLIAGPDERRV
jgi:hypothetical protein